MKLKQLTEEEMLDRLEKIVNASMEKVYLKHKSGKKIPMDKFILN